MLQPFMCGNLLPGVNYTAAHSMLGHKRNNRGEKPCACVNVVLDAKIVTPAHAAAIVAGVPNAGVPMMKSARSR